MKVLFVDDDLDLLDVTTYALRREGFEVVGTTDGARALTMWEVEQPDVLILDVSLPRLNGLEVCKRVRQFSDTPILLLTGRTTEEDVLRGFECGADDYVTKPFSARQLAMRLRALWGRRKHRSDPEPFRRLCVGKLELDQETYEVWRAGKPLPLTPTEFRLLWILSANAGRVVPSSRLVDYAWGYGRGEPSLLKSHISHLRHKLQLPSAGVREITSVPQVGYRLTLST